MNVHIVSKCGKRPQNEDKHNIIKNIDGTNKNLSLVNFYGIYDGHGGKYVSTYLSDNLSKFFLSKSVEYPLSGKYINNVYKYITEDLKKNHSKQSLNCGSTCLVAIEYKYKDNKYLDILNTGDSRCVICTDNVAICKTKDHKPNWPEEAQRIKNLGGQIYYDGFDWRIKDLSVSRAFGDIDAHPFLTNKPDIYRHRIKKNDKFIILACDGLWDVFDNQEAVNIVLGLCYDIKTGQRKQTKVNVAKRLADLALEKGSTDNITIIVVLLN
jgi:serine/threonine protein phosphatase PrpC